MSIKNKFFNNLFSDAFAGITEEEERKLEGVVDDIVVDDINDIGKGSDEELKTEFIATGNESTGVQEPIGVAEKVIEDAETSNITGNQTVFMEPKNYSECKKIANYIKEDKTVMVNLDNVEGGIAQRILDFLSGASSIKGAKFIPVSKRVYVVVSKNVEIVFDGKADEPGNKSIQLED